MSKKRKIKILEPPENELHPSLNKLLPEKKTFNLIDKIRSIKLSNWMQVFSHVMTLSILIIFLIYIPGSDNKKTEDKNQETHQSLYKYNNYGYGLAKKLRKLSATYEYWIKGLTKEELLFKWTEKFMDVAYQSNGDIKYRKADCISSTHLMLRDFGFKGKIKDIPTLVKEIYRYNRAGLQEIRYDIKDIKCGDLIIFKPSKSGRWHMGIVYDTVRKKLIRYVDVNLYVNGRGDMVVPWYGHNKGKIELVTKISFVQWCGEKAFKEIQGVHLTDENRKKKN